MSALDFLLPKRCGVCDALSDEGLCRDCARALAALYPPLTPHERGPLAGHVTVYAYGDVAREMVTRLKYSGRRCLALPIARAMAAQMLLSSIPVEVLVPVPMHPLRRMTRPLDHTRLIAQMLGAQCGLPVAHALRRTRYTKPQASLSREQRQRNLERAIAPTRDARALVAGKAVALVDDVYTSGQTARACAQALLDAGAQRVWAVALCDAARR
ncbi:MAG: ComF family protein [Christensenellales bacterium]|jgi:ComF family protein